MKCHCCKQHALYILFFYGVLILCVFMLYIQRGKHSHFLSNHVKDGKNQNILLHVRDETFIYKFNSSQKSLTEKLKRKSTDVKSQNSDKFSVRGYYQSLANSKESLQYDCEQCALVSSSGQLIGRGLGKEIDANECVFRMNNAPSGIFQEDVGNRTTVRLGSFYATVKYNDTKELFEGEASPDVVVIWGLFQKNNAKLLKLAKTLPNLYPNTKFYAETLKGEDYAGKVFEKETGLSRKTTKTWLSTGWFTVLLAIDLCKKVNLYGFIPDDHCKNFPNEVKLYHYYQSVNLSRYECSYYKWNEARKGAGHRFITEKAIFARWAKRYNMTFHAPSWNISLDNEKIKTPFTNTQSKMRGKKLPVKKRVAKTFSQV